MSIIETPTRASQSPLLALLSTAIDNPDDLTVPANSFQRLESILQDGWSVVFTGDTIAGPLAVSLVTRDNHPLYTSLASSLYDAIDQVSDIVDDYLADLSEGGNL